MMQKPSVVRFSPKVQKSLAKNFLSAQMESYGHFLKFGLSQPFGLFRFHRLFLQRPHQNAYEDFAFFNVFSVHPEPVHPWEPWEKSMDSGGERFLFCDFEFLPERFKLKPPQQSYVQCLKARTSFTCGLFMPVKIQMGQNGLLGPFTGNKQSRFVVWFLMAHIPLMTRHGHFLIRGVPRVILSQMVRSPGVYFKQQTFAKTKPPSANARVGFHVDIIAQRGAWLRLQAKTKSKVHFDAHRFTHEQGGLELSVALKSQPRLPLNAFLRGFGLKPSLLVPLYLSLKRGFLVSNQKNMTRSADALKRLGSCVVLPFNVERIDVIKFDELALKRRLNRLPRFSEIRKDGRMSKAYAFWYDKVHLGRKPQGLTNFDGLNFMFCQSFVFAQRTPGFGVLPKRFVRLPTSLKSERFHYALSRCLTKFQQTASYDLGFYGREALNRSLGTTGKSRVLTAEDMACACFYLFEGCRGNVTETNLDHLSQKRLKPVGDLLNHVMEVGFLNFKAHLEQKNMFFSCFTYGETPLPTGSDSRMVQTWLHSASGLNRAYFFKRHRLNTRDVKTVSKAYVVHLNTMVRRLKRTQNKARSKHRGFVSFEDTRYAPRVMGAKSKPTWQTRPDYVQAHHQTMFKTCLKRVLKPFFRPSCFNAALKQFFNSNPLSQFLDQTNPLAELTHKRRLSFMGLGGLHKQNATMAARSIDPSHLGRLCPIETPEGQNAGLVHSLTCLTRLRLQPGLHGKQLSRLAFPSYKNYVFPQTMLHVNHHDEKPMVHGGLKQTPFLSNALSKLGFVREGASKTWFQKPLSGSAFISVGALQNISLATCCIPFMEHNDGNRALMGSNMQRQALTLATAEAPIVRTGWESQIHHDDSTEQARQCGLVVRVESQNLILAHENAFKHKHKPSWGMGNTLWHQNPKPDLGVHLARATGWGKSRLPKGRQHGFGSEINTLEHPVDFNLKLNAPFPLWFKVFTHHEPSHVTKPYGLVPNHGCQGKLNQENLKNNVFSKLNALVSCCAETRLNAKEKTVPVQKAMVLRWNKKQNKAKPFYLNMGEGLHPVKTRHVVWVPTLSTNQNGFSNGFWTDPNPTPPWFKNTGWADVGFRNTRLRLTKTSLPGAYGGNQGTLRLHKPCLGFASWVQRGQALTHTACSQHGLLALGRNLLLGYTPWQGYNFEDAILINQNLVLGDVLTSLHVQSLVLKTQPPPKILLKSDGSDQKDYKYENAPDFETTMVNLRTQDHAYTQDANLRPRFYDHHGVLKPGSNIGPGVHLWSKGQTWIPREKGQTGIAGLWTRLDLKEPKPSDNVISTSIKAGVNVCGRLLRVFKPKPFCSHHGHKTRFGSKRTPNHGSWWLKPALNTLFDPTYPLDFSQVDFVKFLPRRFGSKPSHLVWLSELLEENKRGENLQPTRFEIRYEQQKGKHKNDVQTWGVKSDLLGKDRRHGAVYFGSPNPTGVCHQAKSGKVETRSFLSNRNLNSNSSSTRVSKPNPREKTIMKNTGYPWQNLVFGRSKTKMNMNGRFKQSPKRGFKKAGLLKKQNPWLKANVTKKGLKKKGLVKKTKSYGLPPSLRLTYVTPRRIQVGDKLSGRHGNKGIVSRILPSGSMPYLPDGTALDLALNPLGVPSRMNVGQLFECLLAFAGSLLKQNFRLTSFDERFGSEASRSLSYAKLYEARLKTAQAWVFHPNFPGKVRCFDGRSGQAFLQPLTVGKPYMLKLIHVVDDKIHARRSGPYSLVHQQPLRGRSKNGGQRMGEMEVWALQGYGAAHILHELLTLKSDSMLGRETVENYLLFQASLKFDLPESFKVLSHECQCLGLDLGLKANHHLCSQTFHPEKRWRLVKPNLSFKV